MTPMRPGPLLVSALTIPLVAGLALTAGTGPANTAPAEAAPAVEPAVTCPVDVANGMTQPKYAFNQAIEQEVWIETSLDTDHNGQPDRVAVLISRPRETETLGCDVPVVFEHSPYRKDVWGDVPYPSVLVDELPQNDLEHPGALAAPNSRETGRPVPNLPGS